MDLYGIPGDTGGTWRMDKFVEYQHEVPSIHYRVLGEYIKKYVKDRDDAVMMCWYMASTYNEVTCVLLQEIFDWKSLTPSTVHDYCQDFWKKNKYSLEFGSARKYAKNMNWFPVLMESFIRLTKKHPYKWLKEVSQDLKPLTAYRTVFNIISHQPYTGRFSTDLFMESILYIQDYLRLSFKEPSKLDWKRCSNLTSGLLNIFYEDEAANEFDKTGKLVFPPEYLTDKLLTVQDRISEVYPEQEDDINLFVGKICSFRNLFKSARYGGFHHDRELGWLNLYKQEFPRYRHLWNRIFKIRREMFDERFLGELHDWDDIRPERKKLWIKEGLTGVEKNAR